MMPLKIELLENKGESYNVVILGIGEIGKKLVREYPMPAYGENHWAIETLTLCEDDAFQHKRYPKVMTPRDSPKYLEKCRDAVCEAITKADILFVVSDVKQDPDYDHTYRFAKLHKQGESEHKATILVDCSGSPYCEFDLDEVYDLIIFNCEGAPNFRPIEMLLTDLYTQCVGLDMADVSSALKYTDRIKFVEMKHSNKKELEDILLSIRPAMEKEKLYHGETGILNGLLYLSIPHTEGLELMELGYEHLADSIIDGQFIVQFGFNPSPIDDSITISLMYGRDKRTPEEIEEDNKIDWDEMFESLK